VHVEVRRLLARDVSLIATVDRSEHVDVEYAVIDGRLTERPVSMSEIPAWNPIGHGPHNVADKIDFCASVIAEGAVLLGAFDNAIPLGFAVVDLAFESKLAWLAFLHVSRPHRRRGAAHALWQAAVDLAHAAGAEAIYVSATPTGSAVGFYLRQGCRLADPVHPTLFAQEPDDIHLICSLASHVTRPEAN
jgi:GNAT superfamily N-acetyltransferase